jgi:very-short-patch-repair endonuclease
MATTPEPGPVHEVDKQRLAAQLRKWQERLLDLSKSNPLLGINRSRVSKLRIIRPSIAELFKDLVLDEGELKMPLVTRQGSSTRPDGDLEEESSSALHIELGDVEFAASPVEIRRRLRRIYDNARTTVEERGVTTLYVTFGTLVWNEPALGESASPLWMVPCQLTSKGPSAPLRLSIADEEMQLNPALELFLRERHKICLPDINTEPDAGSLSGFVARVAEAVREHRWIVNEDVWLSTFSFESLVIYNDLKILADEAALNIIVTALAHASPLPEGSEALGDNLDELQTPAVVPVPIIPADSSQLEAMTYAASDQSVVIHGPPGTGKSQTISNLIADALGRNKTVLFVSAKMAALNVVYQRLADQGLGRFCLEAHSTKAGKTKIIEELRRTLESEDDGNSGGLPQESQEVIRVREELNAYVREIHERREPSGKSIYQAIGIVSKLDAAPVVRAPLPWPDVLTCKPHELDDALDSLVELASHSDVFDNRKLHPWRGYVPEKGDVTELEAVESDLRAITAEFPGLRRQLDCFEELIPRHRDLTLAELMILTPAFAALAATHKLPQGWTAISVDGLNKRADLFQMASGLSAEIEAARSKYCGMFDVRPEDGLTLLRPVVDLYGGWYRGMSPGYWRWRREVRRRVKPGTKVDYQSLLSHWRLVSRIKEIQEWFDDHQEVGPGAAEGSSQVSLLAVSRSFRAAALLRESLERTDRTPAEGSLEVDERARESAAKLGAIETTHKGLLGAVSRIKRFWPMSFADGRVVDEVPLASVVIRSNEILGALPRIREWMVLLRILDKCKRCGLNGFIAGLGQVSARDARAAFERRFYFLWASAAMQSSQHLSTFSSLHREELVNKFRTLDARIRQLAAANVRAVASSQARRIRSAQSNLGSNTEVGILRRELQKRKKIKPLRRLFAEIPRVLQALKPCMLMSPISVSTYLKPGAMKFDLVVFDEASQLPTAESIPSILRASHVIVAGDRNQLPPTSFFQTAYGFEDEQTEEVDAAALEPLESLLDECVASVPLFRESFLKWHYRSRDERLIKFSNHYFYENRLITFPSVATLADGLGVRFVYVADGVWDRGRSRTNRQEARKAASLVIEHLVSYPERSIGVVAMNAQQREAIEDAINEELQVKPELMPLLDKNRSEPFFVKSLENVQGDERDVMLISVGYGKDSTGHISLNFGPINTEGGWRRLNVLVTRAKWQTILVCSMRAHELHGINPANRGAVALKNFVAYAEQNCQLPSPSSGPIEAETNDFEDAVGTALRERGLTVDQQVGASKFRIDLAIRDRRDPGRYVLGIECDGATYHGSRSARDRDLLRQEVLRTMGWRIHRVWSPEWFYDREHAMSKIFRSLEQAEAVSPENVVGAPGAVMTDTEPLHQATPNTAVDTRSDALTARKYRPGEPYKKFGPLQSHDARPLLLDPSNAYRLASFVAALVDIEGPIHEDLVTDRLKERCAVERAGSNVQSNVGEAIHWAIRNHNVERRSHKSFLWSKGKSLLTFRIPGDGIKRSIDMIHREEVELAVLYAVEDQFGTMRDELPRAVGKLFGFERISPDAADIVRDVVDELVERHLLRVSGPQVNLA